MHTLSLFPRLLDFVRLAPIILRLVVSIFLITSGWSIYKNSENKWLGIPYMIFGAMVFIGLYTQITAILAILTIKIDWWFAKKMSPVSADKMMVYVFAVVILLSLIVTGPGLFAFDLPL